MIIIVSCVVSDVVVCVVVCCGVFELDDIWDWVVSVLCVFLVCDLVCGSWFEDMMNDWVVKIGIWFEEGEVGF